MLVINEVDYDNAGSDTDEFVEILNTGAVDIDLTGLSLQLWNGSNTTVYNTIALDPVVLAAGDYFVVGSATVPNVDQVAWASLARTAIPPAPLTAWSCLTPRTRSSTASP